MYFYINICNICMYCKCNINITLYGYNMDIYAYLCIYMYLYVYMYIHMCEIYTIRLHMYYIIHNLYEIICFISCVSCTINGYI
jgi:hypothetical protein